MCSIFALTRETLSSGIENKKDADQPALPRRLISDLVIRFLESITSNLATSKFQFVTEHAGLGMTWSRRQGCSRRGKLKLLTNRSQHSGFVENDQDIPRSLKRVSLTLSL